MFSHVEHSLILEETGQDCSYANLSVHNGAPIARLKQQNEFEKDMTFVKHWGGCFPFGHCVLKSNL